MRKKIWTLFLCLFVVALFTGVAFAATRWIEIKQVTKPIKAEDGGVVEIFGNATKLVVPPDALEGDTDISVGVYLKIDSKGRGRKRTVIRTLVFEFGPSGTIFNEDFPAELRIKKKFLKRNKVKYIKLYNEDGEAIEAEYDEDANELVFYIPDFSYYYFRRR